MKSILLSLLLFCSSTLFVSCSPGAFLSLDALKTQLNIKSFPEQKDYPESDGVVLYELHDVRLNVSEEYDLETIDEITRIIKLFRNFDRHSTVTIHIPWSDKLTDISARIIQPDGTIIVLKNDDFHTISGSEGYGINYSDTKTVKFTFPAVKENAIIEYHYKMYSPHPFLQTGWMIQSYMPKLESVYQLTTSALVLLPRGKGGLGWSWRYQWHNGALGDPRFIRNANPSGSLREQTFTYQWTEEKVPAFKPDPMMPPEIKYMRYVEFAPAEWKSWNDVSEWYNKYFFAPQLVITDKIRNKAAILATNCRSEADTIARVYSFVEGLRYVAIELGDGGYRPNFPQTVLDREYGDCKDKSILLISLLRSLRIDARPVLLLTTDEGVIYPDFPSWDFNHMIVKVTSRNGQIYWLDPTVRYCSLGEIPYTDQGARGLVLHDDNTSDMETIPLSKYNDNVEAVHMDVNLKDESSADFHIEMRFKGQYNFSRRSSFSRRSNEEMVKYCKSLIADEYLNAEVTHCSCSDLDAVDSTLLLSFDVKVPNAITKQGNLVFLNIDPFKLSEDWGWLGKSSRHYGIEFNFPSTIRKTINVSYPADKYDIADLPEGALEKTDGLFYESSYEKEAPGKLTATEELQIRSKDLDVRNLNHIKKFVQDMQAKIRQQIVLKTK